MSHQFESMYNGTTSGSGDPPPGTQNRHVSLANIATAFLSERKSSSRRQSSARRKKHLSIKGRKSSSNSRTQTTTDEILGQRSSADIMDAGIATIFVTNVDNKHRSTTVIKDLRY